MYIDDDGKAQYYEYGRYSPEGAYGSALKSLTEGNWVNRKVPDK